MTSSRTISDRLLGFPLILLLAGIAALAMFVPALHALRLEAHAVSRGFAYSGLLGLALVLIWNIWSDKACFVQPDQSKL